MIVHPIEPVFDSNSTILILGSFPSVASREIGFFYGNPQNRFWKVLAAVLNDAVPTQTDEKKDFLIRHNIALWDVIHSCEITGSSDLSIKQAVPNDISFLLKQSKINKIFTNGNKAKDLYDKYIKAKTGIEACLLPSTSPANASYSLERLIDRWSVIAK